MKFYNDFNAMFNAQSGLKKDMSVFNAIVHSHYSFGNGYHCFCDEPGIRNNEQVIVYEDNDEKYDGKFGGRTINGSKCTQLLFRIEGHRLIQALLPSSKLQDMLSSVYDGNYYVEQVGDFHYSVYGDRALGNATARRLAGYIEPYVMSVNIWEYPKTDSE